MFIQLKKLYPHQILVPMYDIDLIWHSHQLCTEAYLRDTVSYLGRYTGNIPESSKLVEAQCKYMTKYTGKTVSVIIHAKIRGISFLVICQC